MRLKGFVIFLAILPIVIQGTCGVFAISNAEPGKANSLSTQIDNGAGYERCFEYDKI